MRVLSLEFWVLSVRFYDFYSDFFLFSSCFCFVVKIILLIIFNNSKHSPWIDSKDLASINWVSFNSRSQYEVSRTSLEAMPNLCIKSEVDSAERASFTFAPIDVPLFKTCFDRTYYLVFSCKNLYKLIMLTENLKDFCSIILSVFFIKKQQKITTTINSELNTQNSELLSLLLRNTLITAVFAEFETFFCFFWQEMSKSIST